MALVLAGWLAGCECVAAVAMVTGFIMECHNGQYLTQF